MHEFLYYNKLMIDGLELMRNFCAILGYFFRKIVILEKVHTEGEQT